VKVGERVCVDPLRSCGACQMRNGGFSNYVIVP
jgi:threonine dehydrogenase-like Zn-dependent dehydrogenase